MKLKGMFYLSLLTLVSVSLSSSPSPLVVEKHVATKRAKRNSESADHVLRIFNWEDYIAEAEDGDEEAFDTLRAFEEYYLAAYGKSVEVQYETFATNEDMYNIIKLNGANYDLIAPSDYMIQRMIREDMLEEYSVGEDGTYELVPNYSEFASKYHQNLFEEAGWTNYAIGYMWGTFGLLYNQEVSATVSEDMQSWSVLWDGLYNKKISIKDSMREAYLVGLFKVYQEELLALADEYADGTLSAADYNAELNDLLNDVDPETIKKVDTELRALKQNIYGLEVDQGKNDMIKGTIAVNTAWSGDAVYSIYQAAEEVGNDVLRYAIPVEGSNIWFDGWVMPKGANTELAQAFVNFISDPEVAIENMDYIGYTTFIAGDEVLDYVLLYDEVLEDEEGYEIDLTYFFEGTVEDDEAAIIYIDEDYIGGQLATQFPTYEEVIRSAVMRDFGESNKLVIDMWANFKATEIQNWMIVFSVIIVLGVGALVTYNVIQKQKAARRKRNVHK